MMTRKPPVFRTWKAFEWVRMWSISQTGIAEMSRLVKRSVMRRPPYPRLPETAGSRDVRHTSRFTFLRVCNAKNQPILFPNSISLIGSL